MRGSASLRSWAFGTQPVGFSLARFAALMRCSASLRSWAFGTQQVGFSLARFAALRSVTRGRMVLLLVRGVEFDYARAASMRAARRSSCSRWAWLSGPAPPRWARTWSAASW
jgi:hypothetical protein